MLKLPKGLKKKKKKSKKDQELFTEEELEQYKRELRAKQEAAANKSDAGESDGASDVEAQTATTSVTLKAKATAVATSSVEAVAEGAQGGHSAADHQQQQAAGAAGVEADEEWAKFKALTSGVDTILHKTQDELDRIKKESFYQRLPSAAEKKKQEEEEAARREAERLERELQRAAELEAQRDKLAEAVVQLSDSEDDQEAEVDDIFATDYIEAITSGEVQLTVLPDSPVLELDDGPDPFDTAYAEKVIVGADKAKGNKKLVSLGAAVEVLSGRVDREHALALAKPKRKLRKGIQNLLLSESVDFGEGEPDAQSSEPQHNLLDDLADDVPESSAPIDLSVSLHLHLIKPQKLDDGDNVDIKNNNDDFADNLDLSFAPEQTTLNLDLSEFDALKDEEDDEFAELAVESLNKKDEVTVISQVFVPGVELLTQSTQPSWAEFAPDPETEGKPKRPPPPVRPATGPHIVPGAIYVNDEDDVDLDDDPFNTNYADQVIRKTTVFEQDDDFDPRAEESSSAHQLTVDRDLLAGSATDLSKVVPDPLAPTLSVDLPEDFDPFDTSAINAIVQPKATELKFLERELITQSNLKHSLSDPDFDPRADESIPAVSAPVVVEQVERQPSVDFDQARRKSSLSLNIQAKSVGFLVPAQDLLGAGNDGSGSKKPLTPYYAPAAQSIAEKDAEVDPFDTSYVPEAKLSDIELKHIEADLIAEPTLKQSLSDPDFNPRAPPTPVPAEVLLAVEENINIKVLTPAQESKDLPESEDLDPFDTSIAANLQLGQTELKLLENELLPEYIQVKLPDVLDTQSDAQDLGLGDKVLTPLLPTAKQLEESEVEIDPFDTSIAENLAPGETEIKLLESELIER